MNIIRTGQYLPAPAGSVGVGFCDCGNHGGLHIVNDKKMCFVCKWVLENKK